MLFPESSHKSSMIIIKVSGSTGSKRMRSTTPGQEAKRGRYQPNMDQLPATSLSGEMEDMDNFYYAQRTSTPLPIHETSTPLMDHQAISSPLFDHQETSSPLMDHQETSPLCNHQVSSPLMDHQDTSPLFNHLEGSSFLMNNQTSHLFDSKEPYVMDSFDTSIPLPDIYMHQTVDTETSAMIHDDMDYSSDFEDSMSIDISNDDQLICHYHPQYLQCPLDCSNTSDHIASTPHPFSISSFQHSEDHGISSSPIHNYDNDRDLIQSSALTVSPQDIPTYNRDSTQSTSPVAIYYNPRIGTLIQSSAHTVSPPEIPTYGNQSTQSASPAALYYNQHIENLISSSEHSTAPPEIPTYGRDCAQSTSPVNPYGYHY